MDFSRLIQTLIDNKIEDDYVDFKEKWHTNKAKLLHDIICLANNRVDKESYLIIGIRDKTFEIMGVEEDNNRKNQQNLIDFLNKIQFAGGIRPSVGVKTIKISNHELDIIIVKNSTDTPYFLLKEYEDKGDVVNKYAIYTRVRDTNTPINKCADIDQIEYLWKKRFLLHKSPIIRFFELLKNKNDWEKYHDYSTRETIFFNKHNPEYTLILTDEEDYTNSYSQEFYSYLMINPKQYYGNLSLKYFGTKIYTCRITYLDKSYLTPLPKFHIIHEIQNSTYYKGYMFFIEDSKEYVIKNFLYEDIDIDVKISKKEFDTVVLYFNNDNDKINFDKFVKINKDKINNEIYKKIEECEWIEYLQDINNKSESEIQDIRVNIATGKVLKKWQEKYNTEKYSKNLN